MASPLNILYLHAHDMGRYVQPYGYAAETPCLQKLAGEGMLFRQAFCAGPICSPSRAALLTGLYPHCNGMLGLAHLGFRLNDPGQTLMHFLRKAGYLTAIAGTQHIAARGPEAKREIGYELVLNQDADFESPTRAALDFLAGSPAQPFFLDVGYHPPHRSGGSFPCFGPAADERYCRAPAPLPDTPETRRDFARYLGSVRSTDLVMGRVLEGLDEAGLRGNTLVIATTDHGIAFPAMKCNLTDHGLGVMLIMRGPAGGLFSGGRVIDGLVSQVDVFPTLCAYLGLDPPPWLQGQSFLPLARGETAAGRGEVFAEVNYHVAYEPQRAVRTDRWKYIRRFDGRDAVVLSNCDDGPSKAFWFEHGWLEQPRPGEMLFDLVFDPQEANNLAGRPECAGVLTDMRGCLAAWMAGTGDPLLAGPVPAPAGAQVTNSDFYDPAGTRPAARRTKPGLPGKRRLTDETITR